jgi:hypothetical protein
MHILVHGLFNLHLSPGYYSCVKNCILLEHHENKFLVANARERVELLKAAEVHTIIHVSQIWTDRSDLEGTYRLTPLRDMTVCFSR